MPKRSHGRDAWLSDYRESLTQAAGIAYILGFSDHAKTLHELSCQAMGIDTEINRRQKDIDEPRKMRYNSSKKQEGKTMRYEEAQNYIDAGMLKYSEILADCKEIARTDRDLRESMIEQCGTIKDYAAEIYKAVQELTK